jgi:hypothetical protein
MQPAELKIHPQGFTVLLVDVKDILKGMNLHQRQFRKR